MQTQFMKEIKLLPWYRKASKGISLRIVIDNKRAEFSTGIEVCCPIDFEKGKFKHTHIGQEAKAKVEAMIFAAKKINEMFYDNDMLSTSEKILAVMRYIRTKGDNSFKISPKMSDIDKALKSAHQKAKEEAENRESLRLEEIRKQKESYPLTSAMQHYIDESKVGEDRKTTFECYQKNIDRYLQVLNMPNMPTLNFTMGEAKRFQKWLKVNRKAGDVYAEAHVSFLKNVINEAIDWELTFAPNPLERFEKSAKCKDDTTHLTRGEVQLLHRLTAETVLEPKLERTKDIFLFMCYTGLHYVDMFDLTHEHIKTRWQKDDSGKMKEVRWLVKLRSKTGIVINQIIHPEAVKILNKYGSPQGMTQINGVKIFNNASGMNDWLLKLGKIIGTSFELTTKIGRKTFADMTLNAYGHDEVTTKQMMGLTLESTILRKYVSASDERLINKVKW